MLRLRFALYGGTNRPHHPHKSSTQTQSVGWGEQKMYFYCSWNIFSEWGIIRNEVVLVLMRVRGCLLSPGECQGIEWLVELANYLAASLLEELSLGDLSDFGTWV